MSSKSQIQDMAETQTVCKYTIKHEIKKTILQIDCEGCSEGSTIENPNCRKGILTALKSNPNIDSIITSHYKETQYVKYSVEVMKELIDFIGTVDKMAIRDPYAEYFAVDEVKKKSHPIASCQACSIHPSTVFNALKESLMGDLSLSYKSITDIVGRIQHHNPTNEDCKICQDIISQDSVFLFNEMENLRALIIQKGYNINI